MPRVCTVCVHPDLKAIDWALVSGEPLRGLSAIFRVSEDALTRHKDNHLPEKLAKAKDAQDAAQANDLLREVRGLNSKAYSLLLQAEQAGDLKTALQGIREARGCLELRAKLSGELDERPQVNVLVASPEWLYLRTIILKALEPHPEARLALAAVLEESNARP